MQLTTDTSSRSAIPVVPLPQSYAMYIMHDIAKNQDVDSILKTHIPSLGDSDCCTFRESILDFTKKLQIISQKILPLMSNTHSEHKVAPPRTAARQEKPTELTKIPILELPHATVIRLLNTGGTNDFSLASIVKRELPKTREGEQLSIVSTLESYVKKLDSYTSEVINRLTHSPENSYPGCSSTANNIPFENPDLGVCDEIDVAQELALLNNKDTGFGSESEFYRTHLLGFGYANSPSRDIESAVSENESDSNSSHSEDEAPDSLLTQNEIRYSQQLKSFDDGCLRLLNDISGESGILGAKNENERISVFVKEGVFAKDSLITNFEGNFAFKYQMPTTSKKYMVIKLKDSINVDGMISEAEFLPHDRYIFWLNVYYRLGKNLFEIGIVGRNITSFINHSNKPNVEARVSFPDGLIERINSKQMVCSYEKLERLFSSVKVDIMAIKDLNEGQELLCDYGCSVKSLNSRKSRVIMPESNEKGKCLFLCLDSENPMNLCEDLNANTEEDNDSGSYSQLTTPSRKSSEKRFDTPGPKDYLIIFLDSLFTPLRKKIGYGNANGTVYDILNAIECADTRDKEAYHKALNLVAKYIMSDPQKKAVSEIYSFIGAETGLRNAAAVEYTFRCLIRIKSSMENQFFISGDQWNTYISTGSTNSTDYDPPKRKRFKKVK